MVGLGYGLEYTDSAHVTVQVRLSAATVWPTLAKSPTFALVRIVTAFTLQ